MDTRSAVLLCCASSFGLLLAQLNTGVVEGTLRGSDGRPLPGVSLAIAGGTGLRAVLHSNANGRFETTLPYGRYTLSVNSESIAVFVAALETTRLDLVIDPSGAIRGPAPSPPPSYPEAYSLAGLLLSREPSTVTEPLDFAGLSDNRLAVVSQRGFSWTATQFKFQGMDATDSYQPGRPVVLPDVQALDEIEVRGPFAQTASSSYGAAIGVFLAEPRASWHAALTTADTGGALSAMNLPSPANRGMVRQPDRFHWFTRDRLEVGGPLARWADIYASGSGQWASQTQPLAAPGTDQRSRLLFGNMRGRVRPGDRDRLDALYSGSRIDLSDGGVPASLEALTGNRMAPSFVLPGGFPGASETDHLDFVQVGWTHLLPAGAIELRYGYSISHLNSGTEPFGQSHIELLGGLVSGAPPLGNLAIRPRHEMEGAWLPGIRSALRVSHRIAVGGGWERADPRNRFTTPSDRNLIAAAGLPAFAVEFNTPLDSRAVVRSFSLFATDHVSLTPSLALDFGVLADFARGSLPAQSSPGGAFVPARTFAAQPDLIVWNNLSPRAGFAWQVPHARALVLRGSYSRRYAPLAGRYLDFANPNSLGGSVLQASAPGRLLLRFGGPYSSISPALARPYADEFDVGAEIPLVARTVTRIHLFRRDDKSRIAALDTGVPAAAFTPVLLSDPGPDGIAGTFDDQPLTVYAQNPATLGQDRYLLTNPPGLRMLNAGMVAELRTQWKRLTLRASFVAEKSYGPANPGDAIYEDDPGVIGALLQDPNAAIHAAGRSFVDRAYIGKLQGSYRLPPQWGGIEITGVADYMDGLVFARQLLVTGLPQGPLLVGTTVRGSPEGGNRSQYVVNLNLRISRRFRLPLGGVTLIADVLNATNAAQRLQENDLSGPSFNQRLPVAIQPPRFIRLGFRYEF